MLGAFLWSDQIVEGCVMLVLHRDEDGAGCASIRLPRSVGVKLQAAMLPPTEESMGIDIALGYGLIIAALGGLPFSITGDATTWRKDWGPLVPWDQFDQVKIMAGESLS
jgi:hypothetical protein